LLSLDISSNRLRVEGTKLLAKALESNQIMTALNSSSNSMTYDGKDYGDMSGVVALADAIPDMGALLFLDISKCGLAKGTLRKDSRSKFSVDKSEWGSLDSHYESDMQGCIALADAIKVMGAMTSLNLANNSLGELVSDPGWVHDKSPPKGQPQWQHTDGRKQKKKPKKGPVGIIALAGAIKDMGAMTNLDMSDNDFYDTEAGKALGDMLAVNTVLKQLDLSNCNMQIKSTKAFAFAVGICNNEALSKLNMSSNRLSRGKLKTEPGHVMQDQRPWGSKDGHYGSDMSGIVAIANTTSSSTLILKDNRLATKQAGKALAKALAGNSALKELDVSSNNWKDAWGEGDGPGFATELAVGIRDNGALLSLNLANNRIGWLSCPEGWQTMDGSDGKQYFKSTTQNCWATDPPPGAKPEGVIALANAIPDMRALSIANVMGTRIGKEYLSKLQQIMHSKPNLISLCGIANDATEADLSGLKMDADDAIILAAELPDKGALSVLSLAKNGLLTQEAGKILGGMLKANSTLKQLDVSSSWHGLSKEARDGPGFAQELAVGIKDNGALTSLNLSSNSLTGEYGNEMSGNTELSAVIRYRTTLDIPFAGITALANAIPDTGALLSLNLSNNYLGQPSSLPEGWSGQPSSQTNPDYRFQHTDGRRQGAPPEGSKFEAIIILANAIKDMGAMTSLNLASNKLGVKGATIIGEAIKVIRNEVCHCGRFGTILMSI
jgi:hypothetical protein